MPARPSSIPAWCTNNPSNMAPPSQSQIQTGYQPGEVPTAEVTNQLLHSQGEWIRYLDENSTTTALFTDLAISARMVSQAIWAWSLTSRTLAWDQNVYIAYPGAPDAANTIAPGSVTIPAGSAAYVTANAPFSTPGSTTTGSAVLTSVLYADQVQPGWTAAGAGIPSGTTVQSVGSDGASITLSAAATATASNVQLTFGGSGTLTVQVAAMSSMTPSAGTVILARATDTTVYVGVGTGQMRLHDGEKKGLLEGGYVDVRRLPAGQALTALQAVYQSQPGDGSNTAGALYPADATNPSRCIVMGVTASSAQSGATVQVVSDGFVDGFSGLTVGQIAYLDPSTPGGIKNAKPTTPGQWIVPVGIAVSSTAILLTPRAGAQAQVVPTNLTLPGTVTAGSVVSGKGFATNVSLGGIYFAANTNQKSGSTTTPVQLKTYFGYASSGSGASELRWWPAPRAGSVVAVQIVSNYAMTGPLLYEIDKASVQPTGGYGLTALVANSAGTLTARGAPYLYTYTASFARGLYPFAADDVLCGKLGMSSSLSSDAVLSIDITVEMAS